MQNSAVLPESVYERMDLDIRELVRTLNNIGIVTIKSSGGQLRNLNTNPFPWISIDLVATSPEAMSELIKLMAQTTSVLSFDTIWVLRPVEHPIDSNSRSMWSDRLVIAFCPENKNLSHDPYILGLLRISAKKLALNMKGGWPSRDEQTT